MEKKVDLQSLSSEQVTQALKKLIMEPPQKAIRNFVATTHLLHTSSHIYTYMTWLATCGCMVWCQCPVFLSTLVQHITCLHIIINYSANHAFLLSKQVSQNRCTVTILIYCVLISHCVGMHVLQQTRQTRKTWNPRELSPRMWCNVCSHQSLSTCMSWDKLICMCKYNQLQHAIERQAVNTNTHTYIDAHSHVVRHYRPVEQFRLTRCYFTYL